MPATWLASSMVRITVSKTVDWSPTLQLATIKIKKILTNIFLCQKFYLVLYHNSGCSSADQSTCCQEYMSSYLYDGSTRRVNLNDAEFDGKELPAGISPLNLIPDLQHTQKVLDMQKNVIT